MDRPTLCVGLTFTSAMVTVFSLKVLDIHRMLCKDQRKELQAANGCLSLRSLADTIPQRSRGKILFFSATWPDYVAKLAKLWTWSPLKLRIEAQLCPSQVHGAQAEPHPRVALTCTQTRGDVATSFYGMPWHIECLVEVKKEDLTLTTITQTRGPQMESGWGHILVTAGFYESLLLRFMNVGTDDNKRNKLSELYSVMNVGQSIIFVNTRLGPRSGTRRRQKLLPCARGRQPSILPPS